MASKTLFLSLLLALALQSSAADQRKAGAAAQVAGGPRPVVDIINAVTKKNPPPIRLAVNFAQTRGTLDPLRAGQEVKLEINSPNVVYYVTAVYGNQFAGVKAYNPARDEGKSVVYWKADNWGWSLSYDNISYKKVAEWEIE